MDDYRIFEDEQDEGPIRVEGDQTVLLGLYLPPGWLRPALVCLGVLLSLALAVFVLVSGARTEARPTATPLPHGSCAPFCTAATQVPGAVVGPHHR